jgi:4-carboxymuconolactone decarboxylase
MATQPIQPDPPLPPGEQPERLPKTFLEFATRFPKLAQAHQQMGHAAAHAGPLDQKTQHLVKVGICVGAGLESALRSHARRALGAGATREEIEHAIVLSMSTCGFPRAVAAWRWVQQQFAREDADATG